MKINVFIERSNQNKRVNAKNIPEILNKLSINPQTVIIVKNGELITDNEPLKNNDKVKLLSVISGG